MRSFIVFTALLFFSCNSSQENDHQAEKNDTAVGKNEQQKVAKDNLYLVSTYDDPEQDLSNHKVALKKLSGAQVFALTHKILTDSLEEKHKSYFRSHPAYELLYKAHGDLFLNGGDDYAFVVYDKNKVRITIICYNAKEEKYKELFRDIKVENGLKDADCNYSFFGTHDYKIADGIVYQEKSLLEKPGDYLKWNIPCKITNINKDEDFVLDRGCFSPKAPKTDTTNSLCLSTDAVYNNWECLKYDPSRKVFVVFYGQAFAD